MSMTHNGDALSRFRGVLLQDVTCEQLDAVLGPTSLTPATADQLEQANLIAQAVVAQRTNANGNLPIPEESTIITPTTDPLGTITIKPTGTEIWVVKAMIGYGMGGDATSTMYFVTDTDSLPIKTGDTITAAGTRYDLNDKIASPIELTSAMWLTIEETGGAFGLAVKTAYTVASR